MSTLLVVLPHKSFQLSPTWSAERVGSTITIWTSSTDRRRGRRYVAHSQAFEDEKDAKGAYHLFTEAVLCPVNGQVDLRGFCFWDEEATPDGVREEREEEEGIPKGAITLSSLFARAGYPITDQGEQT